MKKQSIATTVANNAEILKAFTTHTQLRAWAIANGMDNRSAFPRFKAALKNIGIDYDLIKAGIHQEEAANIEAAISHELILFSDAKTSANGFGICDERGAVLWYGRFFDNEDADEQSRAELAAAKKAVWLASKIKEAVNAPALRLRLMVDAQWLTYQDHGGQKGYVLTQMARKYNIELDVQWISGKKNPADQWTTTSGYKKWQDNDLASIALAIDEHSGDAVMEDLPVSEEIAAMVQLAPLPIVRNPYYGKNTPITHTTSLGGTPFIDYYHGCGKGIAYVRNNEVIAFHYDDEKYSNAPEGCDRIAVDFSSTEICFRF